MAVDSPKSLFVYELGLTRTIEREGVALFQLLGHRVNNEELARLLNTQVGNKQRQMANVDNCLHELGASPLETPSSMIDGLRRRFETFSKTQPSPEAMDLFALGIAIRIKHVGMVGYQELLDLAEMLGEERCVQCLRDNLTRNTENAAALERHSHELRRQLRKPQAVARR